MSAEDATQPLASYIRTGIVWYVGCCRVTGEPCMVLQDRNYYDPKCWDVVPVVPKSALDAATAHADQAEAACGEMREALQMVVDHYSMPAEAFGEKYYMRIGPSRPLSPCYMNLVNKALSSAPGKSTADELRRLRELKRDLHRIVANHSGDHAYQLVVHALKQSQAAQPPRAERSEP